MLESEQPGEDRLLNISHFPAQGVESLALLFLPSRMTVEFTVPQALCQSLVILIPPISLPRDSSPTVSYYPLNK